MTTNPTNPTSPTDSGANPTDGLRQMATVAFLLDRSGSMASIADDVVGGYNTFLEQQRAEGTDVRVTLVKFDTEDPCDVVHLEVPISEVLPLAPGDYVPRGGTPLLDALGRSIALVQQRTAPDAGPVVFVVITDGKENASSEFTLAQIRELIGARTEAGWQFVFLSADVSAFHEAGDVGFARGSSKVFHKTKAGTRSAFAELSTEVSAFRDKRRRGEETDASRFFSDDSMVIDEFLAGDDQDTVD